MNKVPNRNYRNEKSDILSTLFSLHRFGIKPGLDRTMHLLKINGNPHNKIRTIHVAGTNGKGSVSSMIASVFQEAGYKTGLYTSPHIVRFNERIKINGIDISDDELITLAQKYLESAFGTESTFFEITTAMAFDYFNQNEVDIAIIEAGMGGRNDATNVINPEVSIITNVSLDHTEYLGNSIAEIAHDKGGIIKHNIPLIIGSLDAVSKEVVYNMARNVVASVIESGNEYEVISNNLNVSFIQEIALRDNQNSFLIFELPLPGFHQVENLSIVLSTVNQLRTKFPLTDENIADGISNVKVNTGLRGRIDLVRRYPRLFIDCSHNPDGVVALMKTIESIKSHEKYDIVFAAMKDKDIEGMIERLIPIACSFSFVELETDRAASRNDYDNLMKGKNVNYRIIDIDEAIGFVFSTKTSVICTGTFYLAEQLYKYLENNFIISN
jgi:dihydrofolate synthase/folylpolyglutamate synthase